MSSLASIGLGFSALGASEKPPLADEEAKAIFKETLALGISRFDTAPLYGGGQSEDRLGKLLSGVPRDSYILSTKVGRYRPYGEVLADQRNNPSDVYDYSADATVQSIEGSLKRLGTDRLDIVYVHDCDNFVDEAVKQTLPALVRLRDQGVIGQVGIGSNNASTHEAIVDRADVDVLMVANSYSLLTQDAGKRLFPTCQRRKVGVELAAPFNSGILAVGSSDARAMYRYATPSPEVLSKTRKIEAVCKAHGISLKQAALQYCARHPAVDRLILGLVAREALRSNLNDFQAGVPQGFWEELESIGIPSPTPHSTKSTHGFNENKTQENCVKSKDHPI